MKGNKTSDHQKSIYEMDFSIQLEGLPSSKLVFELGVTLEHSCKVFSNFKADSGFTFLTHHVSKLVQSDHTLILSVGTVQLVTPAAQPAQDQLSINAQNAPKI